MSLETAIQSVASELMMRVRMDRGLLSRQETTIVIDPFVNADNGEVLRASKDIENMIIRKGKDSFDGFTFVRMTSENLRKANYAMNGAIRHMSPGQEVSEPYYQVSASVVNLKTGKVVGRSDVRVAEGDMDYTSTLFYKDSPMYIKDRPLEGSIETATSEVGSRANRAYYDALETLAMLVEAETAYESGNYRKSLALLEEVMKRPDGQLMKTYAGLYSTYYRLGHLDLAEKAFDKLLSISVEKNRILTVKFLFDVNSLEFWRDPNLKAQYGMWLQRIGKYFHNSQYCLKITGHCSRTGAERYNDKLSQERAYKIQKLLQPEFPNVLNRSEAIGRGFKDNIVGTGTDDERDAIDRRVEFFVVDCE
jgi:outer membrane protein OmpA-like peptidoglycan-associated protein